MTSAQTGEMQNEQPGELNIKRASNAAMASLLNLTLLPAISFIAIYLIYKKTTPDTIDRYHTVLGFKLNIIAAAVLFLVSGLMILLGGFNSP
ncbi:MAG: hypothetical protein IMF17_06405, partial [Proteobacteria bacterium]|nr:hypothetical protein [Pseudomonadota bacterium]